MNKNCLLIGGNGFIGKNLVTKLIQNDYSVSIFDISHPKQKRMFSSNQVTYIEGDVNNTYYLIEQIDKIDSVVWLIHTTVPATSTYDLEFDLVSNIPPLIRFLQEAVNKNLIKTFIYLSSGGAIYGNPLSQEPINENNYKDPISSYGLTKLIAEEYITYLVKGTAIKTFILRPSNVYGKYQNLLKPQGIIGHLFNSILSNKPITIFGEGVTVRDYIHVDDLAEAIISCIKIEKKINSPVKLNISSCKPISVNEIIDKIKEITQRDILKENKPIRDFDCTYNVLENKCAKDFLNWSPKISLDKGLIDLWEWISVNDSFL